LEGWVTGKRGTWCGNKGVAERRGLEIEGGIVLKWRDSRRGKWCGNRGGFEREMDRIRR